MNRSPIASGGEPDASRRTDSGATDGARPPIDAATDAPPPGDGGGAVCTSDGACDDADPCTDDACDPATGRCAHRPNTARCSDGVLCNGGDSCLDGACTVHDDVDPCPGASRCDPETDTCVGCDSDGDCPGVRAEDWSACDFGGDVCAMSGVRGRDVTSYRCLDAQCVPETERELEHCARATDGNECAAPVSAAWSECVFTNECATLGSRSRIVTSFACALGECKSEDDIESAECMRPTDGMACEATTFGEWSACTGFTDTCDTSGLQTRARTMMSCISGSCGGSMTSMESQACSRDTSGTSCGGAVCDEWSPCAPIPRAEDCSPTGVQTRSCHEPRCSEGVCTSGASTTESRACTLDTEGERCAIRICGPCMDVGSHCERSCTRERRTCTGSTCGGTITSTETMIRRCGCGSI